MPRRRSTTRQLLLGYNTAGPIGDLGLLILRVFAGLALAFAHGINKVPPSEGFVNRISGFGFPAPEILAWISGFAELGGGILLALGLATRPVAFLIVINMSVAVYFAHGDDTFRETELALLFLFVAAMYSFVGGGRYSIDRRLNRATL